MESDPIGLDGGLNTYAYVENMPTMQTDSFGLFTDSVTATCARNPAFCAEVGLMGAVGATAVAVQNSGAMSEMCDIPEGYFDLLGIGGSSPASPPPDDPYGYEGAGGGQKPSGRRTEGGGSPALRGDPYHPDAVAARVRPPYRANPAHNPRSPHFNSRKTPEPADAPQVYQESIRTGMGTWYGRGADGQFYRFFSDNAGGVHFSGIIPRGQVPTSVLRHFGR